MFDDLLTTGDDTSCVDCFNLQLKAGRNTTCDRCAPVRRAQEAARPGTVLFLNRDTYRTEHDALTAVRRLGVRTVGTPVKRKLRDGRDCAPQGRPGKNGPGQPVWRVEIAA